MRQVNISASGRYDVIIDKGILKDAGHYIKDKLNPSAAALISDSNVSPLYSREVLASLKAAGIESFLIEIPAGEEAKSINTAAHILDEMARGGLTRSGAAVSLGGGVVGDISGFCAAIYLRGVPFVQIPTTFLAAIDSSVGGKTGVNLKAGKNLAGAFWQPGLVLCDPDAFSTLPEGAFADGVAEAIKYGAICDAHLFHDVSSGGVHSNTDEIIERCVSIKGEIVREDEFDRGNRQLLNFGHTVGHAIEKFTGYGLSHGRAVGLGMVAAARMAKIVGISREDCEPPLCSALENNGLPSDLCYKAADLIPFMLSDKKRMGGELTLVLPEMIGSCVLKKIEVSTLPRLLEEALNEGGGDGVGRCN